MHVGNKIKQISEALETMKQSLDEATIAEMEQQNARRENQAYKPKSAAHSHLNFANSSSDPRRNSLLDDSLQYTEHVRVVEDDVDQATDMEWKLMNSDRLLNTSQE